MLINPTSAAAYSPTMVLHLTSVTVAVSAANAPVVIGSFTAPRAGMVIAGLEAYVGGAGISGYLDFYIVRGSNTYYSEGSATYEGSGAFGGNANFSNTSPGMIAIGFSGTSWDVLSYGGLFLPVLPGDVVGFRVSCSPSSTVYVVDLWVVLV